MNRSVFIRGITRAAGGVLSILLLTSSCVGVALADDDLEIRAARWLAADAKLKVVGHLDQRGATVVVENADTGERIGTARVNRRGRWSLVVREPDAVPCGVRARYDEHARARDVHGAPSDCDDGQDGDSGNSDDPGGAGGTGGGQLTLLAANDLGMHCADLDYQVFSILPPFNVVHTQLVERGATPRLLDDIDYVIDYTAATSANDPAGAGSINTTADASAIGVFKTNFWGDSGRPVPLSGVAGNQTFGGAGYGALYPSVLAGQMLDPPVDLSAECEDVAAPSGCPGILNVFEPMAVDSGLPVPDLNELAGGTLHVNRQSMPGPANVPQPVGKFDRDVPFFAGMPFGHVVRDARWWSAEGIPILPIDDNGNVNSYPMMRMAARDRETNAEHASLDIVLPVASEADCQNCHAEPFDCLDPRLPLAIQSNTCNGAGLAALPAERVVELDDAPGDTVEQKLLNAAKINILRLHDIRHGDAYTAADGSARACDPLDDPDAHCLDSRRAIQCSQCHYSPALDLAQAGPVDEPEQGPNGRQQTRHVTMSSVMHRYHGTLPPFEGETLFPSMPAPDGRDRELARQILGQTCYQCHPGKRTQCLRGAMFSAGVVCQDCHGDMEQVGNDFSIRVASDNPADFETDGSLRVPWASEPGCQSCHTGDAANPRHPAGAAVAADGIRLLQAYTDDEIEVDGIAGAVRVARMYDAPDSRFAENTALNANGDAVPVLYRLSKGHGGVMCEGCHNSTHAVWPNADPFANDNIASEQLQGHHGTLIECSTCHAGFDIDDFKDNLDGRGRMKGPHGMHPVASDMWNEKHKEVYEDDDTPGDSCQACHGNDGMGTVLSITAAERTLECKNGDGSLCNDEGKHIVVPRGTPIGCGQCHENPIGRRED